MTIICVRVHADVDEDHKKNEEDSAFTLGPLFVWLADGYLDHRIVQHVYVEVYISIRIAVHVAMILVTRIPFNAEHFIYIVNIHIAAYFENLVRILLNASYKHPIRFHTSTIVLVTVSIEYDFKHTATSFP